MKNHSNNTHQSDTAKMRQETLDSTLSDSLSPKKSVDTTGAEDLIDDIKKDKIDPLTEGDTNLGYEEKAPRKKELEQTEHLDQDEES